jgi:aminopeptidase
MLTDIQLNKYADVLMWGLHTARSSKYRKNDIVLIRCDPAAVKVAEYLQARILDEGMHPIVRTGLTTDMERIFYEKANNRQLVFEPPGEKELHEHLNGGFYLYAPESLTHLSNVDPRRIAKVAVARKPLRDILHRREETGAFSWTLCMLPTAELARHARLSFRQYTNQVVKACYLDEDDPVQAWKAIYKEAAALKKWMNSMRVKYYHIESESIDLRITPGERRRWLGISGHNIPSFEIFTSPDWRGTEGVYFANQPSFRSGNRVEGVELHFKKGKAARVQAKKGEDFVVKQMSMDAGACRVGEFSLTDKRFSRINKFMANTLYDENYGGRYGNCHIALGSSYSDTYDGNPAQLTKDMRRRLGLNDSALHWDLVNTEKKTVSAYLTSGAKVIIYENGMFKH